MVHFASALQLHHIIDYNTTQSIPRPKPGPLPTIDTDFDGTNLLETSCFVSLVLLIDPSIFNDADEKALCVGLLPVYFETAFIPLDEPL
jgi:hypothetical protein